MKKLDVYLTFAGNCAEALTYYTKVIGGEIASMQRFNEGPKQDWPDDQKDLVMHAEYKCDNIYFMASDSMPGHPFATGTNVSLTINMSDEAEQDKIFNGLAEGGNITMPLEKTFWGARFGMVTDKFGISWMLNCTQEQPGAANN